MAGQRLRDTARNILRLGREESALNRVINLNGGSSCNASAQSARVQV
ncbi:MAG: hypothetical protein LBB83_01440 [Treponema sp.]|nr:hypothetical protein [Treponema sp.]